MLETRLVHYGEGSRAFEGYLAAPGQGGRLPAVLLAHDWSGRLDHIDRQAERLAELGYAVLAIDVYGAGRRGSLDADNSDLMNPLLADRPALARSLVAAVDVAEQDPRVDPERIAIMGYCLGGLCALDLARTGDPRLKAAISIHGALGPPPTTAPISASILVLHGWEDPFAPQSDVLALTDELTRAGADWQLHAYGHAYHAFTAPNFNLPEQGLAYNADADRRSWQALTNFLDERLRSENGT